MGWPLLTLGGLETLAAIFYAVQVGGEIDHYESALAADLAVFRREELAHIQGTTSRFLFYRLAEVTLALGGAGVSTYDSSPIATCTRASALACSRSPCLSC